MEARCNTLITRSLIDIRFPPDASCNELSWLRKLQKKKQLHNQKNIKQWLTLEEKAGTNTHSMSLSTHVSTVR